MTWEYNQTSGKSFTVTCRGQYQEYCSYDGGSTYNWENVGSATTANYTESLSNTSEFTLSGSSVSVKSSNTTLYDKTGTVTFTCSSDTSKKASISLRQRADVQEDTRYRVVVSPTSLVFESTAGSQRVNVTPQYQTVRWATGTTKPSWPSSWSDSSSSSWSVSLSADSGISQSPSYSSGYTTVSVTANPSETSERTGTLTVWHDSDKYGTSTDVSLRQRKKDRIEYEYEYLYSFSATPTSLSYPKEGGTKSVSVTSTVQSRSRTIINGSAGSWSNWGTASSVGYTGSVSGTGFSLSGNNGATAGSNSNSSERTGTLTLKQTRSSTPVNSSSSSSTISIQLRQDANITTISDGYQYEHKLSVSKTSFDASGGSATISVTSRRREIYHMSNAPTTYLTTSWESWSSTQTVSGTGFSKSGNTLNVSSNSSTSSRTGNVDSSQNQPNKCSLSSYQLDSSSLNVPLSQDNIQGIDIILSMYLVEGIDLSKTFSVKFNYGNPLDLNINTPIEYSNIIHNAYIDAYCAGINYDNLFNPEDYIDISFYNLPEDIEINSSTFIYNTTGLGDRIIYYSSSVRIYLSNTDTGDFDFTFYINDINISGRFYI